MGSHARSNISSLIGRRVSRRFIRGLFQAIVQLVSHTKVLEVPRVGIVEKK